MGRRLDEAQVPLLLELVRTHVPPAVEEFLPRDLPGSPGRCLPATRIGLEVLRYFGVKAEPLPMRALAVNERWQRWQHEEGGEGTMPDEAWSVVVGLPSDGPGVDLHLVLVVEDKLLLDLDAIQFARPARDIHVPATVLLPLESRFHEEHMRQFRQAGMNLADDGRLDYVEHPDPPVWKSGKDYRKAGTAAGPVIRKVREMLREKAA